MSPTISPSHSVSNRVVTLFIFALCVALSGCGASSGGGGTGNTGSNGNGGGSGGTPSATNLMTVTVDGTTTNGMFVSVALCVPGTSNCQTINHVLVDTGSSGLRLFSSAVTEQIPYQIVNGSWNFDCIQFGGQAYAWGPMATADVQLANETVHNFPVQLMTYTPGPTGCTGSLPELTQTTEPFNGILGLYSSTDCGGVYPGACASTPTAPYYSCNNAFAPSICNLTTEPVAQQMQSPVPLFSDSNRNGFIIQMPSVSSSGSTSDLTGSLIFGIGTASNNTLPNTATNFAFPLLATAGGSNYFLGIDSGSPYTAFLTPSITGLPTCSGTILYCPAQVVNFNFTASSNDPAGIGQKNVPLSVAVGPASLPSGTKVFPNEAAPSNASQPAIELGAPFFFGRSVWFEGSIAGTGTGAYPVIGGVGWF